MSDKFNRGYVDDKGNSVKNSAYDLIECIMTNVNGESKDIRNMVGHITITENIFSPALVCQMGIRDESNFLEEFGITGNESLEIKIVTSTSGEKRDLDFLFYVQKYDDYARSAGDNQVQAYTLIAVSEHGYIAPLKTISRSVGNGLSAKSNTKVVEDIYVNDLGVDENKFFIKGQDSSKHYRGIITQSNPIVAAAKILKGAADINQTPYFLYQDLSTNVYLSPLSFINSREENPVYKTFINTQTIKQTSGDYVEYFERSRQMTKVISNIGLAPSLQAKKGAFQSKHVFVDIANKTIREDFFNVNGEVDKINPEFTTSKVKERGNEGSLPKKIADGPLFSANDKRDVLNQPNTVYHYVNPAAYSYDKRDEFTTLGVQESGQSRTSRAYISAYDACSHKFTVMGDSYLNPGRTIELKFPKATDPIAYKQYARKSETDFFDQRLSGDYLIFSSVHSFIDGVHTTTVVAKTDSIEHNE